MALDPALAALSGAAVGALSTWLLERARWARQLHTRWDEARLSRYGQFLVSMNAYHVGRLKMLGVPWVLEGKETEDRDRHLSNISNCLSEMKVLSSEEVHTAALEWFQAVECLVALQEDDAAAHFASRAKVGACHDQFLSLAKKELKING